MHSLQTVSHEYVRFLGYLTVNITVLRSFRKDFPKRPFLHGIPFNLEVLASILKPKVLNTNRRRIHKVTAREGKSDEDGVDRVRDGRC